MPRGVYDRKKGRKTTRREAKAKRTARVAPESHSTAWVPTERLVDRHPDLAHAKIMEQAGEIVRLGSELRQYQTWLRNQGDLYMDVVERLISIHRQFGKE